MAEVTLYWPVGRYTTKPLPAKPMRRISTIVNRDQEPIVHHDGKGPRVEWIVREGAAADHPVHKCDAIYERLAGIRNAKDAESFANTFGLLNHREGSTQQRLGDFLSAAGAMRKLLDYRKRDDWAAAAQLAHDRSYLAPFTVRFGYDEDGEKEPLFQARDLMSFIVYQLARDWSHPEAFRYYICDWCGKPFYYGPGTGHRERARGEPTYCEPDHQSKHAYEKRKQRQRKGRSK